MKHVVIKLLMTGWYKVFDTEEEARDELYKHICQSCLVAEGLTTESTIEHLLATNCGCEYDYEVIQN